jgi:hypothetical protein
MAHGRTRKTRQPDCAALSTGENPERQPNRVSREGTRWVMSAAASLDADARSLVQRTRAAQRLPERVTDRVALSHVAEIISYPTRGEIHG